MPTKIQEILVTGVVGPKPFRIPIGIILIVALIVDCLSISGLISANNIYQQQQQAQNTKLAAIANTDATATAYALHAPTQASILATQSSATQQALDTKITERARVEIYDVKVVSTRLLYSDDVQIAFSIVNRSNRRIQLLPSNSCNPSTIVSGDYKAVVIGIDGHLNPNEGGVLVCSVPWSGTSWLPEKFYVEIHADPYDCWVVHPSNGAIETCR